MSPWGTGYTEDGRRWSADHEAAGTLSSMPRSLPRRSAATAGGDLDKKSPQAAKARPAVTTASRQKSTHVGSRARSKVTANDLDSAVSAALTELNAGVDREGRWPRTL